MSTRHLLVTNDFPPKVGGIQAYLWELWRRLDPDRFVVLTASSHPDAATFDRAQAQRGVRIERVRAPILFFPTPMARVRISSLAARIDAGLVVLDPALPLGLVGPGLGRPYAVVLHGAEVAAPARLPVSRQLMGRVLSGASLVISAGRYPGEEAARVCGGRLRRVVEVPPGVDCRQFSPLADEERRRARQRLGLPVEGPLVASVSRLVPRKGMDVLIEAVARLVPSFPDLTLAIAGDGRQAAALGRQVRRSGAPVRLLGRISEDDKAALLGACDVFSMACRNRWLGLEQEGFGIVFVEAAASGVPVVAGRSGGADEAVEDGVTGLVVGRPDEPGEVALALRQLLADEELRRRMGARGRARAERNFDYDVLAPRLSEALDEVAGSGRHSAPPTPGA